MESNGLANIKSKLEDAVFEEQLKLNKIESLLRKFIPAYRTYIYLRIGFFSLIILVSMCSYDYRLFFGEHPLLFFLFLLLYFSAGIYGRSIYNRIENMTVPLELLQHQILSLKEEINLISSEEANRYSGNKEKELNKNIRIDSLQKTDKRELILNKLKRLKSIIENKKESLSEKKEVIMDLMEQLCIDKAEALAALEIYKQNFNEDFIEKLKSLTTSYHTIKDLVFPFIELEIIESKYPHNKIINNRKIAAF